MKTTGYEIKDLEGYSMTFGTWEPETRYWYKLTLDGTYKQVVAAQQKIYDLLHHINYGLYQDVIAKKITATVASNHLIDFLTHVEAIHNSCIVLDAVTSLDLFRVIMSAKEETATLLEQGDGKNG